ncbi:hypothetical protein [Paenibacillus oryzisoli]|uniref:hypothetical protein n=1 Tax=Paenibacillus oryzisoli TaxID=1850517 RepID=UPI0012F8F324|nr:hypothetical protein [Paenibacillus oryzisoli]
MKKGNKYGYAEALAAAKRPVILFDQPYNQSLANEFMYRASNWLEVKNQIDYLASMNL